MSYIKNVISNVQEHRWCWGKCVNSITSHSEGLSTWAAIQGDGGRAPPPGICLGDRPPPAGCVSISKDIFAKDIFAKDIFAKDIFAKDIFWTSAIWMGRE